MQPVFSPSPHDGLIEKTRNNALIFNAHVAEITILDRRGKTLWKKNRGEALEPIRWDGLDAQGDALETGQYTCKIVYQDKEVVYLPFVFMK
jgi:flagellar hook assembly protein FlgD